MKRISDLNPELLSPSPVFTEETLHKLKHTLPEVIAAAFKRFLLTKRDFFKGIV